MRYTLMMEFEYEIFKNRHYNDVMCLVFHRHCDRRNAIIHEFACGILFMLTMTSIKST